MARSSTPEQQMRMRIAQEAARLIAEDGMTDFLAAKRKAAQRLGAPNTRHMPGNQEIEEALLMHQRLFQADTQPQVLRNLRRTAVDAMKRFESFKPRLTGAVLNGTAGAHAEIELHLFAPAAKDVALFLLDHKIPFETGQRRFRFEREVWEEIPLFHVYAGDHSVVLAVFPLDGRREAPRSPVDGRPMARADLKAVEALLAEKAAGQGVVFGPLD